MSLAPELDSWSLSDTARGQLAAYGISLSELYRLMRQPQMQVPGLQEGQVRVTGHGLTAIVCGQDIISIGIDGATRDTCADWALERAVFRDADVVAADALVQEALARQERGARLPRQPRPVPERPAVQTGHVLDRIHPALREEITRQVDGDFSRLVIHSRTKVTINPPR